MRGRASAAADARRRWGERCSRASQQVPCLSSARRWLPAGARTCCGRGPGVAEQRPLCARLALGEDPTLWAMGLGRRGGFSPLVRWSGVGF